MPHFEPVPISLTMPGGKVYKCEGILEADIVLQGEGLLPGLVGLKVPIDLHKQGLAGENDEIDSIEFIKLELLTLINEGVCVEKMSNGIKFKVKRTDLKQKPITNYWGLATFDSLMGFAGDIDSKISGAVITDNPFTHKAIHELAKDANIFAFMLSSKDLSKKDMKTLKNNISNNPIVGALKISILDVLENRGDEIKRIFPIMEELMERVYVPEVVHEALSRDFDTTIDSVLDLVAKSTDGKHEITDIINAFSIRDANLSSIKIPANEIDDHMPLIEISNELFSKEVDLIINGHQLKGTAFIEITQKKLGSDGSSVLTPILLTKRLVNGEVEIIKGTSLEQLGDVIAKSQSNILRNVLINPHQEHEKHENPSPKI